VTRPVITRPARTARRRHYGRRRYPLPAIPAGLRLSLRCGPSG
jgi:hypothetical protein